MKIVFVQSASGITCKNAETQVNVARWDAHSHTGYFCIENSLDTFRCDESKFADHCRFVYADECSAIYESRDLDGKSPNLMRCELPKGHSTWHITGAVQWNIHD